METTPDLTPKISVIIPGMNGAQSVAVTFPFWTEQDGAEHLELLVMCPDADSLPPSDIPSVRFVSSAGLHMHEARAKAVRLARGTHVVLAEDHSVPEPGSVRALLRRVDEGWDAVGPAMSPGTRRTWAAQASFLLGYGEWMAPVKTGETNVLPGHNVMLRRAVVMTRDNTLEDELMMAHHLVREICENGRSMLDAGWQQTHYDPAELTREMWIFMCVGIGFGAARTRDWPLIARLAYPLMAPVTMARHWVRGMLGYIRAGRAAGLPLGTLPVMTLFSIILGLAEAVGAVRGFRNVASEVWKSEIKPITAETIRLG